MCPHRRNEPFIHERNRASGRKVGESRHSLKVQVNLRAGPVPIGGEGEPQQDGQGGWIKDNHVDD